MVLLILTVMFTLFVSVFCIYKTFVCFIPTNKKRRIFISLGIFAVIIIACVLVGSFVMAFFVQLFMCFVLLQAVFLLFKLPAIRHMSPVSAEGFSKVFSLFLLGLTFISVVCGYHNTKDIRLTSYTKTISDKSFDNKKILFVSDIHLDAENFRHIAGAIRQNVFAKKPEVLVIGGDLVDNGTKKEEILYFANLFGEINEKVCPVIFVYGNHDIMSSDEFDAKYIADALNERSVRVLSDETAEVDGITFVGRMEYFADRYGEKRKSIESFGCNKEKPIVVVDHRPMELALLAKWGADLSLSGHTHNGQIFPIGVFCELFDINELQYGKAEIGDFSAIVSSGAGTWGMPVRTQGICEIVEIDISPAVKCQEKNK